MASNAKLSSTYGLQDLEFFAVRDGGTQLDTMLQVVEACAAAGTSLPPEVVEFFGDAIRNHGSNIAGLRDAMTRVRLAIDADALGSRGVMLWKDALPDHTTELRIRLNSANTISMDPQSIVRLVEHPWPSSTALSYGDEHNISDIDTVEYVDE